MAADAGRLPFLEWEAGAFPCLRLTSLNVRRAIHRVAPMANNTTVTELSGIKTAQTSGDNKPAAAMEIPTTL